MKRPIQFSEKKFRTLSTEQQHKKCATLLKDLFHNLSSSLATEYEKLCSWLALAPLQFTKEEIEKRFHWHMRQSGRGLAETDFLSCSQPDKSTASPWLKVGVYLDGLRSCHNIGSIVRTVEAFRLGPIYLSESSPPVNHPQIRKTSMGAWKEVSLKQVSSIDQLPRPLIALETVPGAPAFNKWIYPDTCTMVIGNEERGIRQEILTSCDYVVTIPLSGKKNSLNVANAFAIVAAEIATQQRGVCDV